MGFRSRFDTAEERVSDWKIDRWKIKYPGKSRKPKRIENTETKIRNLWNTVK